MLPTPSDRTSMTAPPVRAAVIVVATGDFEVYHGVVDELRSRDAVFT
jgi:hypothetical protein